MWNKYLNWTIQIQNTLRFKRQYWNVTIKQFRSVRDDLKEALVKLLMEFKSIDWLIIISFISTAI